MLLRSLDESGVVGLGHTTTIPSILCICVGWGSRGGMPCDHQLKSTVVGLHAAA